MEEKKVTIGDKTLDLPSPFVVFATQNPLEHEGTYPLPEAQLDRFLMRIILTYPSREDERAIYISESNRMRSQDKKDESTETKFKIVDLIEMINYIADNIRVDTKIYDYISDIISATRKLAISVPHPILSYGASTRAGLALIKAGRVRAVMAGRDYMLPEDIVSLSHDILDHRIGLSYDSMSEWVTAYSITSQILDSVRIP